MTTTATKKRNAKKAEKIAANLASAKLIEESFATSCGDPLARAFDDPIWNPKHRLFRRVNELINSGMRGGDAEAQARQEETVGSLPVVEPEQDLEELVAWLETQTWSDFASSLARQYRTKEWLSDKQVASATSMKAKMDARDYATEVGKMRESTATFFPGLDLSKVLVGLDLSELPSGYYADPDENTRLKIRVSRSRSTKVIFVNDDAEYGSRKRYGLQAPGELYKGDITEVLERVMADPAAASRAYGRLVGRCGVCGRRLEDETSIANGIGPICAQKF